MVVFNRHLIDHKISPCILLSILLTVISFSILLPYLINIQFYSIIASLFSIFIIAYILSSIFFELLAFILKRLKKRNIQGCNRKLLAISIILVFTLSSVYSIQITREKGNFDVLLEYPNVSFMFIEVDNYKLCTVCEDNVIVEYVGIWNKYLELHRGLGYFNISSTNPKDIAAEIFRKGYKNGYIPNFNGNLAHGPWYFIISFWNLLGYRGPWWVFEALSSFSNFSVIRIPVNRDILALHVCIVAGYKDAESFELAIDWCGVEKEWDDVYVDLEAIYNAIESIYLLIPRNTSSLTKIIEKASDGINVGKLKEIIMDLIDLGIPVILSVDSNKIVDILYGPIGFSGMLFSMLYVPFLPFQLRNS